MSINASDITYSHTHNFNWEPTTVHRICVQFINTKIQYKTDTSKQRKFGSGYNDSSLQNTFPVGDMCKTALVLVLFARRHLVNNRFLPYVSKACFRPVTVILPLKSSCHIAHLCYFLLLKKIKKKKE